MDLSKLPKGQNDFFPLLDFFAKIESETESSISLSFGRYTNRPSDIPADSKWFFESCGPKGIFQELGWIDLHYPCKGHKKVLIRMDLPKEYHRSDQLAAIINALFYLFSIPPNTIYVAYYFSVENLFCTIPNDEFGQR